MSYRSTRANGMVNDFEGTEMSPVELDPKGSNVGTTTPYIEEPAVNEPPPEITNNFPLFDQSPTDRTGQTVGCVVEGFRQTGFGLCRQAMESARLGGIFGLVERAARMSAKIGTIYTTKNRAGQDIVIPEFRAWLLSTEVPYSVTQHNYYFEWSAVSSIFTWEFKEQQQTTAYEGRKYNIVRDSYKSDLLKSLNARLSSKKCENAINELLKKLDSESKTLLSLYDAIDQEGGFWQTTTPLLEKDGSISNTAAFADKIKGKRAIVANGGINRSHEGENYLPNLYAGETTTLIHELLHHALKDKRILHTQIAVAMKLTSAALGDKGITVIKPDKKDLSNPNKNTDSENSTYMNNWINNYCPTATLPKNN